MAKKESTFTSMVLTLFLVTLGASGALGYVFELTKGAISEAESAKKNLAITRVLPEFNNKPNEEFMKVPIGGGDSLIFYIGKMDEDTVGYAIESYSNSAFAGYLGVLAGFTPEERLAQ
jgi:electron transport complex protein RnfG